MRASVYHGPRDIRVEEVPDATLASRPTPSCASPTPASAAATSGPTAASWRSTAAPGAPGTSSWASSRPSAPRCATLRPGQQVIAPFAFSDGTCDFCAQGLQTSCRTGGYWGGKNDGGQGEAVRVPLADGTLVPLPGEVDLSDDRLAAALATLTDVMGTGHHGGARRGVAPGRHGRGGGRRRRGPVRGARRPAPRRRADHLARPPRRPAGDRTPLRRHRRRRRARRGGHRAGARAHRTAARAHVLEAWARPLLRDGDRVARPGGIVGHVGVPADPVEPRAGAHAERPPDRRRRPGARLHPGADGGHPRRHLDPSPVLDTVIPLEEVPAGYAAMDDRPALKVLVRTGAA